MKKPIFIIESDQPYSEEASKILEDQVKNHHALKDYEVLILWQCRAKIYYPPTSNVIVK